jgi:putative zinc finger/helix-turn-helix YgiT family protein
MDDTTKEPPARRARDKPFPWRCPRCRRHEVYRETLSQTREIRHDGRLYTVRVPLLQVPRCLSCGELLFDNVADEQISRALRQKLRLLQPEEIRGKLDTLSLSQAQFAQRLGVAKETVSRWVTGSMIQSRALDNLMRLYFGLPEARAVLARRRTANGRKRA